MGPDVVITIRCPDFDAEGIAATINGVAYMVGRGEDVGEFASGVTWEVQRPIVAPENECRMCGATVEWSPLCSACCGVVEVVWDVLANDLSGSAYRSEVAAVLHWRGERLSGRMLTAALRELRARELVPHHGMLCVKESP